VVTNAPIALYGLTWPRWWVRVRGLWWLRSGFCPACYSSPPVQHCPVCAGWPDYGPKLGPALRALWRRRWLEVCARSVADVITEDLVLACCQTAIGGYELSKATRIPAHRLYPLLQRLEDAGLVAASWGVAPNGGPRRRYYRALVQPWERR
jgi:hypothetical protein